MQNSRLFKQAQDELVERIRAEQALRDSNQQLTRALDELQQAQEMAIRQERLAAVGQLAAGLAHQYNNLMSSIVLYSDMLLRSPFLDKVERGQIETIRKQGIKASEITLQVQDFGRQAVLTRTDLDLVALVSELVAQLRETLPSSISLIESYGEQALMVHADPDRLRQMVVNVASNARDAMPAGGGLDFAVMRYSGAIECVICGPVPADEWVKLMVSDTGAGIAQAIRPHIFEPFFTTRSPLASGLGLSQVFGIVGQHGGHLDFITQVGKGTTFSVYLPALSVKETPAPIVSENVPKAPAGAILVVEDDPVVRGALVAALEVSGYSVLAATSGREAQVLFEQFAENIALVLSDMRMPGMDGLELARALAQFRPDVRVVLVSGQSQEIPDEDLSSAGVVGWLEKPINLASLRRVVEQALA